VFGKGGGSMQVLWVCVHMSTCGSVPSGAHVWGNVIYVFVGGEVWVEATPNGNCMGPFENALLLKGLTTVMNRHEQP
jgi:hypothetical protein